MTIIPIDKSSIKKNRDAGSTRSHIFGVQETTFKVKCTVSEFDELKSQKEQVIITTWTEPINGIITATGHLFNADFYKILKGEWEVNVNNNIETISHLPIPDYSYRYENTPIECDNCKNKIPFKDIQHDCFRLDDMDTDYDICPICKQVDTFEYKFQSIDELTKS